MSYCLENTESTDSSYHLWEQNRDETELDVEHQRWYSNYRELILSKLPIPTTDLQKIFTEKTACALGGQTDKKSQASYPQALLKVIPVTLKAKERNKVNYYIPPGMQIEIPTEIDHEQARNFSDRSLQSQAYNHQFLYNHNGVVKSNAYANKNLDPKKVDSKVRKLYELVCHSDAPNIPIPGVRMSIEKHCLPNRLNINPRNFKSATDLEEDLFQTIIDQEDRSRDELKFVTNSKIDKNEECDNETSQFLTEVSGQVLQPGASDIAPDEARIGTWTVPKKKFNIKKLRFPQNFCGQAEEGEKNFNQGRLLSEAIENGGCFRIALPSGHTLRVPALAAKMFDRGKVDVSKLADTVVLAEMKQQDQQKLDAAELVNEETLKELANRSSLTLKAIKYADLLYARPIHEPSDVGEVLGMHFASWAKVTNWILKMTDIFLEGFLDTDVLENKRSYKKVDLAEIVQTEHENALEDYASLKKTVISSLPLPADPVPKKLQMDKLGNAHECMRQYLKDHKMNQTAQSLTQEWWQNHEKHCREFSHDMEPYHAAKQYLDLARSYKLLLDEYKITKRRVHEETRKVNRCNLNLRFMVLNFKRYAAKNAQLRNELDQIKKVTPENHAELNRAFEKLKISHRGLRQLSHSLRLQLNQRKLEVSKLKKLIPEGGVERKKCRQYPNDSLLPEYHGVNPHAIMCRRKPIQMLRPLGMAVTMKVPAHDNAVTDSAVSPFRHFAVTTGADGKWRGWDITSISKSTMEGSGHSGAIHRCEFHPSGQLFATGGMDEAVNFWNAETGDLKLTFTHSSSVSAISFHSSGDFLVSGCNDGNLILWDVNSERRRSIFSRWRKRDTGHHGAISNCQVIPFSNILMSASEDGQVRLWDIRTSFMMATTLKYDCEIKLWDLRKIGKPTSVANYAPQLTCDFSFDHSCHLIALALNNGQVNFWDLESGTTTVYPSHQTSTTNVTWDIWGEYLLSGDETGNIFLWA